jgi:hypothetical protein
MRQAILAIHMYAHEYDDKLPQGRDNNGQSHTIRLSNQSFTDLVRYSGNSNILDCPNFLFGTQPRYAGQWGYLIGYNYLGDINTSTWPATGPDVWHSPRRLAEGGTNYILADANHWGGGLIMAPHGKTGPILFGGATFGRTTGNETPQQVGAAGGNVGFLDGSVDWQRIGDMQQRRASSYYLYLGNW